jgi:hypothetical protein
VTATEPDLPSLPSTPPDDPPGLDRIEFIEYATARPLALGREGLP